MDEASSLRYSYALLGVGFLVIIGAVLILNPKELTPHPAMMTLTSPVFKDTETIPTRYTCDDQRTLSPELKIDGVPKGTQSLILVIDDPDVPKQLKPDGVFDHWVVYGIPPETTEIPEGGALGAVGVNGRGEAGYTGPCPPPEYEPTTHRYIFTLYATDITLNFIKAPTKAEVLAAIEGHVLETAVLTGTYDRSKTKGE